MISGAEPASNLHKLTITSILSNYGKLIKYDDTGER